MRVAISIAPFAVWNLFLLRILFHGSFLLLYPFIVVYLVVGCTPVRFSEWSVAGTVLAGVVAAMIISSLLLLDYMTLKRRPPPALATITDFLLTGALVPTMWILPYIPVVSFDDNHGWFGATKTMEGWNPFFQTIRFGIPSFFFLYMLFLAITPLIKPNALNSFFAIPSLPSQPALYDGAPIYKRIYGPLRSSTERQDLERCCSAVIFRRTIARKHPFEPPAVGVVRGLFAVYALIGLITYGMAILAEAINTANGLLEETGQTVQRSVSPLTDYVNNNLRIVTATTGSVDFEAVNISVTVDNRGLNFVNTSTSGIELDRDNTTRTDVTYSFTMSQSHTYTVFPVTASCGNTTVRPSRGDDASPALDCVVSLQTGYIDNVQLSFPSAIRRYMWVFDENSVNVLDPPATTLSAPHVLLAGANYDIAVSPEAKVMGNSNWLRYTFDTIVPSASTNMSTIGLNVFFPGWLTTETMMHTDPPSWATTLLGVLGRLGGVFVTINGIFVIIFGRTVWAVAAGGRPITPFGIFSNFAWFRASIHQHYPRLQSDCETDGMAGFLEEVAMDVGIVQHKDRYRSTPMSEVGGGHPPGRLLSRDSEEQDQRRESSTDSEETRTYGQDVRVDRRSFA